MSKTPRPAPAGSPAPAPEFAVQSRTGGATPVAGQPAGPTPEQENRYHTYTTHRIPWFVRFIWICFWIGLVWYMIRFAIPSAKNYF